MPYVEAGGARVAYRVDGRGPGLVLVHGTGGSAETSWTEVIDRLARRWTVVRPDYAGSGDTVDAGGALSLDALAAQVVATAEAAGALPFHLFGFSLGAAVAVKIAAEHPEKLRTLVPLGGFLTSADSRLQFQLRLWRDLVERDREALARLGLLTCFGPAYLDRFDTATLEQVVAADLANNDWQGLARQIDLDLALDLRAEAARIGVPTLVVGCRQDQIAPPGLARELAAAIPGAAYAELDCGHAAALEAPEALLDLVEPFLLRHEI
jgi:3-oxoadipate enol-lactonase